MADVVQPGLGLAAEHGFFVRLAHGNGEWEAKGDPADFTWKEIVHPILQVCKMTLVAF